MKKPKKKPRNFVIGVSLKILQSVHRQVVVRYPETGKIPGTTRWVYAGSQKRNGPITPVLPTILILHRPLIAQPIWP